jgi:uncharacterized lipoprotein NlpE involved in copper resistance
MLKTRMVALALVVPALALTACGGSDSGSGSSDKDQITDIVNQVAKTPVTLCDHLSTAMMKSTFNGSIDDCKTAGKAAKSDGEADIKSLDVSGDTATVKLSDNAGDSTVKFAKEDGSWVVTSSGS